MAEYIFGVRSNITSSTSPRRLPMFHRALQAVSDTVAKGGRILFVGTKRQAQEAVKTPPTLRPVLRQLALARGTLTNWKTVSNSIKRLRALEEMLASGEGRATPRRSA